MHKMNYKQFTKQQEINFSKTFLFNQGEESKTTGESTEETSATPVEEKEVTPENKETHESSPTTNTPTEESTPSTTEEGVLQNNNIGSNQTTKPSNPSNTWDFGSLSSILGTAWENRGKAPKRATGPRPAPHYITMEGIANWMGNVPAKGSPQDVNPRNHPQKSNTDTPSSPAQNTQTQEPVASEESQTQVTVDSSGTPQKNNSKATLFDKGFWSKGSLPGWIIDGRSKFVGKAESAPKTHEAPSGRITSEQSATSSIPTPTSTTPPPATTEVLASGAVTSDSKTPAGSIGAPTTTTGTTVSTHIAPNGEIPKPQGTPSKTDPFSFLRDERNDGFFSSGEKEPFEAYVDRVGPYLPNHEQLSSMGIDSKDFLRSLWEEGPRYNVPALPEVESGSVGEESSPTEDSGSKPVVAPVAVTSGSTTTTGSKPIGWSVLRNQGDSNSTRISEYAKMFRDGFRLPVQTGVSIVSTETPSTPSKKGSRNIVDISERNRKNMDGYINEISDYFATKNKDVFRRPNETYEEYLKRMGDTINKTAETYHVDPNYLGQHWFNRSAANKMTPEQVQNDPNIPDFLKNAAYENNVRQNYLKDPSAQKEVFDAFQNRNKDEESKKEWQRYVYEITGVSPENKDEFAKQEKYLEDNMVVRSAEIEGLQKTSLYFKDQYEQSRQRIINDSRLSEDQKKAAIQKLENDIGKTEADAIDFAQNTAKNLTKAMLPGKDEDLSTWWGRLDDNQKTGLIAGGGLGLLTFLMMMGKDEKDATDWILGLGLPVLFVGAGSYLGSASKADPTKFDPNRYKAYKKQRGIQ